MRGQGCSSVLESGVTCVSFSCAEINDSDQRRGAEKISEKNENSDTDPSSNNVKRRQEIPTRYRRTTRIFTSDRKFHLHHNQPALLSARKAQYIVAYDILYYPSSRTPSNLPVARADPYAFPAIPTPHSTCSRSEQSTAQAGSGGS